MYTEETPPLDAASTSCRSSSALHAVAALRTQVGMNALCQEQSIVSASIIFFSSGDLLSNTSPVGLGLRQATEKSLPLASAMPRVKARAFLRLHVETMYCHTQRIHLKWEKKVIYPLVRGAEACKKDTSSGYQYRNSMHVELGEMQCKTEVTNTLRT